MKNPPDLPRIGLVQRYLISRRLEGDYQMESVIGFVEPDRIQLMEPAVGVAKSDEPFGPAYPQPEIQANG